jgi:hypothetical protein
VSGETAAGFESLDDFRRRTIPQPDYAAFAERTAQRVAGNLSTEEMTLHRLKVALTEVVSAEFMESCVLDSWQDALCDQFYFHLQGYVYAEKLAEETLPVHFEREVYFAYPSSPWQFFKKRHPRLFPRWFRWRWPVQTKTETRVVKETRRVKTAQFAAFPMSTIRTPEKLRGDKIVRWEMADVD